MNNRTLPSSLAELQQQYRLLEQEYAYEKESYLQKSRTGGILHKIRQGFCWYPVGAGRNYYNSLNLPVIEITKESDDDTEHNFEYGRPCCFLRRMQRETNATSISTVQSAM